MPEQGSAIIGRYVSKGTAYGFKSSIIECPSQPSQMLIVSYPKRILKIGSRKDPRVKCLLPAEAKLDGEIYPGVVMDMNTRGCRLIVKKPINHGGPERILETVISIGIHLPEEKKPAVLQGKVRAAKQRENKTAMDIQFVDLSEETIQKLNVCIKHIQASAKAVPAPAESPATRVGNQ
jgi:hypothetical protein